MANNAAPPGREPPSGPAPKAVFPGAQVDESRRFEALVRVYEISEEPLNQILDYALSEALLLTASAYGYIYFYDEKTTKFTLYSWSDNVMRECAVAEKQRVYELAKTGFWGEAVRQRRAIIVNDFAAPSPYKQGYPEGHVPLRNYLTFPIIQAGEIKAVIGVANKDGDYGEYDLKQLELFIKGVWSLVASKIAENELRLHQERLEQLVRDRTMELQLALESAKADVWSFDGNSIRFSSAPWSKALFGSSFTPGSLMGIEEFHSRIHPEDLENVRSVHNAAFRGEINEFEHEYRLLHDERGWIWVVSTGRVLERGENGQAKRLVGLLMDVSLRKSLELETIAAKELAEEATRAKSAFLANMSHEIRTPMNTIIGMAHLTLKTELNARQRDYLDKIKRSGQHLLGIINDILDFSKIEAGKLDIDSCDFEFDKLLDDLIGLISHKAMEKGLELILEIDPAIPKVLHGDSRRLGQILLNYANNALKFTQQGEVVAAARVIEESNDELTLRFEVRDTGIGLSHEQISMLFTPFQQADYTTTRKYGGTGLGLAISKRLAELMHGTVGVESQYGKGSTFWCTARLGKASQDRRVFELSPDLRGQNALVVDDNPEARRIMTQMLRAMSFNVRQEESGEAALAAVRAQDAENKPFDFVFLDLVMPGLDGIETAKALDELPLTHNKPKRVIVTAHGREEVLRRAELAGLDGILLKPVTTSILFDLLVQVLGVNPKNRNENNPLKARSAISLEGVRRINGAKVLLVEDNELNRQVAIELLHGFGLLVEVAENGKDALDLLAKQDFDLVLMDMQMPVMDGLAATRELRGQERFKSLPVLAMTANTISGDRERCLDAGMNDYVPKPIDPEQLFSALLKWISPCAIRAPQPLPRQDARQGLVREAELGGLREVPGLDVDSGLRRLLGNVGAYLSLLGKFVSRQEKAPEDIREALAEHRREDAQRLAHTLKGLAGSIGAEALREKTELLENAIRSANQDETESALIDFASCLWPFLAALRQALPGPAITPGKPLDYKLLAKATAELTPLLETSQSRAKSYFSSHLELFRAGFGERAPLIEAAIARYDFEKALAILREAD